MKVKIFIALIYAILVLSGCGHVESHERTLTHPPKVFGEYVTVTAPSTDFEGASQAVSIPGRRESYGERPIKHNIVLSSNGRQINVRVTNPASEGIIGPHVITISFLDGPVGHVFDTKSFTSEAIGPGQSSQGTVASDTAPEHGLYYWSYAIAKADHYAEAVKALEESLAASAQPVEGDDDEWDDEDW